MNPKRYIENLKSEFKFNLDSIFKYDKYTNVLWEQNLKEVFKDEIDLNNVEQAGILAIQHKMLIIYLVSVFESLIQDGTNLILNINFRKFSKSEKMQLTYSEIFNEFDIKGIKDRVIERELLKIAYKSIKEQLFALSNEYNFKFIELDNNSNELKFLIEVFQHRNILLHNKGIITQTFIENTGFPKHTLGDYFPINEDYISEAITQIKYLGDKLLLRLEDKYI